jgi:replication-associated recombination protein RarA
MVIKVPRQSHARCLERYLSDGMVDPAFYRPVTRGLESRIAEMLRSLKQRNNQPR